MKKIIFLLLILISSDAYSQKKKKQYAVKGSVTYQHIYKGGAKPTDEILQQCCQPKPYADKKLYLKKNYYAAPDAVIQTDSSGRFTSCLPAGIYKVYLNNEENKSLEEGLERGQGEEKKWLTELVTEQ